MAHTPGPWIAELKYRNTIPEPGQSKTVRWRIMQDKLVGIIVVEFPEVAPDINGNDPTNEDDARFIVAACNSHDELLAACSRAVRLLELLRLDINIGDFLKDDEREFYHDIDNELRAAITKAKGGA